ncbi:MAG: acyl-CoA synthetase [Pseudomonadota bacterium]
MSIVVNLADKIEYETAAPMDDRWTARTVYEMLAQTVARSGNRPAVSFQIKSGPKDKKETLTWAEFQTQVTRTANYLRSIGIGEADVVAYVLPNCNETAITLAAGATAGIVSPVNPLLSAAQIGAILAETGAKAVVTLAPFPKSDLSAKVSEALRLAPGVQTLIEVDLRHYLTPPVSWLVPLLRPKPDRDHRAKVVDFATAIAGQPGDALTFEESDDDRICTYFHTGGTTGMPKVAQHRHSGIIYNGWCGKSYLFSDQDVLMCPLPLFHVLAAYPVFASCLFSGAHMVMPTPAGYRGDGVFDNFWKLIERYGATFMITVPTAAAALMQRPVDADVSTLRYAVSGSAPLPVELFKRFEAETGLKILEGYGMTETTCLISINPPEGERKIGSVGLPFPYTDIRILDCGADGAIHKECGVDEIGEICVVNPGVNVGATYTEPEKNTGLYADGSYLRTGDLGRIDADGYLWITGRAKDLIIRGGHNIDPATIEEALMAHPDVSFAGAIGQPDAHSGELPAVYVELRAAASVDEAALMKFAQDNIGERAAQPKHLEILDEMPKTAVGKVFKPALRKKAITRIFDAALAEAELPIVVDHVFEDKRRGLVAALKKTGEVDDNAVNEALGVFARPWIWNDHAKR